MKLLTGSTAMNYTVACTNYDWPNDRFEFTVTSRLSLMVEARVVIQHHSDHRITVEVIPQTNFVEAHHFNTFEFLCAIHNQLQDAMMNAIGEDAYTTDIARGT